MLVYAVLASKSAECKEINCCCPVFQSIGMPCISAAKLSKDLFVSVSHTLSASNIQQNVFGRSISFFSCQARP